MWWTSCELLGIKMKMIGFLSEASMSHKSYEKNVMFCHDAECVHSACRSQKGTGQGLAWIFKNEW